MAQSKVIEDSLIQNVVYDTSKVNVRIPSKGTLNQYRNNKEFLYDRVEAPLSFWDKIKIWINNYFQNLFSSKGFSMYFKYFLYLITAVSAFLVIFILLKSNVRGIFYGKTSGEAGKNNFEEEDINRINFDEKILDAVNNNNYRLAVRLHYLKMLKHLSDKKIIEWQLNKTNSAYSKEIQKTQFHSNFEKLTSIFEWIWYGELPVDKDNFIKIKDAFFDFDSSINQSK